MKTIDEILTAAHQRAEQLGLPYAGAVTPLDAWQLMQSAPGTKLIDVRTRAEMDWVGSIPDAIEIEWATYPDMSPNPHFMEELEQHITTEGLLLFICRSAHRSDAAAALATQAGFADCYNVLEGFEGDKDDNGQRGTLNGWRKAGLPWHQS